jgi:diguanylate cyclase (GGDEF)-like protein/PAS domain S-box-containing protein
MGNSNVLRIVNPAVSSAIALDDDPAGFKQLFKLSPDPTWVIDGNRFVECNEAAIRTLGYPSRDKLLNIHPSKLSPPRQADGEDSYVKAESMMNLARTNGLHRFEWIHTKADGTDFPAEVTLSAIQLGNRRVIYCVWRDITERKQIERTLRESEAHYSTVVENVGEGIGLADAAERFTFANRAADNIFGVARGGLLGRTLREFATAAQFAVIEEQTRHRKAGQSNSYEIEISRSDGQKRRLLLTAAPRLDDQGQFVGSLAVFRDITESKQAEEALRESEARLRDITFSMADWVWEVDDKCVYTYSSQKGFDYFGTGRECVIGKTPFDFMPPDEATRVAAIFAETAANKAPIKDLENWNIKSDGQRVCLLTNGVPMLDAAGNLKGYRGVDKDITERKNAEQKLLQYHGLMSAVMENFPGAVSIIDSDLHLTGYNNQFKQLLEFPDSLFEKSDISFADFIRYNAQRGEYGPGDIEQQVTAGIERARKFQRHQLERVRPNGMVLEVRGEPLPNGGFVTVYLDITERKQLQEQVRELAFYDPLTQLPNRRLLGDRLSQTLAGSKRSNRYGALIFLDLDNFKTLNDKLGHAVGDLLLVQAARRMKSCVREVDTVARYGGDEFVVLMDYLNESKAQSKSQASSIAEKIRTVLAEPYALKFRQEGKAEATIEHRCTASIGVIVFIDGEGSPEDFLRWADSAMYQAKGAGGNLIRFYEVGG